jgi:hypothetical protein
MLLTEVALSPMMLIFTRFPVSLKRKSLWTLLAWLEFACPLVVRFLTKLQCLLLTAEQKVQDRTNNSILTISEKVGLPLFVVVAGF